MTPFAQPPVVTESRWQSEMEDRRLGRIKSRHQAQATPDPCAGRSSLRWTNNRCQQFRVRRHGRLLDLHRTAVRKASIPTFSSRTIWVAKFVIGLGQPLDPDNSLTPILDGYLCMTPGSGLFHCSMQYFKPYRHTFRPRSRLSRSRVSCCFPFDRVSAESPPNLKTRHSPIRIWKALAI